MRLAGKPQHKFQIKIPSAIFPNKLSVLRIHSLWKSGIFRRKPLHTTMHIYHFRKFPIIALFFLITNVALAVDDSWAVTWSKYEHAKSNILADAEISNLASDFIKISRDNELEDVDYAMKILDFSEFLIKKNNSENAIALLNRSLFIFEKYLGQDSPYVARCLYRMAELYDELKQSEKALPLRIRVVDIVEKSLGYESIRTAQALSSLVNTYIKLFEYKAALPLKLRALAITERNFGDDSIEAALDLNDIGRIYMNLSDYEKAEPIFVRALKIRENKLGINNIDTAKILSNISVINFSKGNYSEALTLQLNALNVFERNLGSSHPDVNTLNSNIARTYVALSMHEKALLIQENVYRNVEAIKGQNHPEAAIELGVLAEIYSKQGDYTKALSLHMQVLDVLEKQIGQEHPLTAAALNDAALAYSNLAMYEKAIPLFIRALEIGNKTLGENHPDVWMIINNISVCYYNLGKYDDALYLQNKILTLSKKSPGSGSIDIAKVFNNLSLSNFAIGNYEAALLTQIRALEIFEINYGGESAYVAGGNANLARIYRAMGQRERAIQLALKSLAVREKLFETSHSDTAQSLNVLAWLLSDFNKYDIAVDKQLQAVSMSSLVLGPDHPTTAIYMGHLGYFLDGIKQPNAAIIWLKLAVNNLQAQRAKVASIGIQELKIYTDSVRVVFQKLADVLTLEGRLAEAQQVLYMLKEEEQFDLILRSPSEDPRRTRMGYTHSEQRWVTRYSVINTRIAALGVEDRELQQIAKLGGLSPAQRKRQRALAADLVIARQAFLAYMTDLQAFFSSKGLAKFSEKEETSLQSLRELQSLMGKLSDSSGSGVALVQYFVTDDQVSMLVTTPGVQLVRTSKVKASELNRMIADFRRQLRDSKSQPLEASHKLYQLLIAPISEDLHQAGAQTVMLSLDGALRYLPFAALHDGRQYLAQRWRLPIYTSVVRERLQDEVPSNWQVAGLGLTKAVGGFPALPAVHVEMRSIVKTDAQATGILPGEIYLDDAFNAVRLKAVGKSGFNLLHVASHFRFSPGTEANSYLLLGDGQRLTLGDIRTQNYRFDQVDLLTLSACETGLGGGRDEKGREIEGFGVIAQQQGAKAVLATLWPVADSSTADLMSDMYRRRQTLGLNKAEALRQAQVAMLQGKYSHPFYWAPFILMGNWK